LVMKKRIQNAWFTKDIPFWRFNISMFVWIYDIYVYYICIYIYTYICILYTSIFVYIYGTPLCTYQIVVLIAICSIFLIYCNTMFTPVFSNCSEMP
jgi:hypothetical protein